MQQREQTAGYVLCSWIKIKTAGTNSLYFNEDVNHRKIKCGIIIHNNDICYSRFGSIFDINYNSGKY